MAQLQSPPRITRACTIYYPTCELRASHTICIAATSQACQNVVWKGTNTDFKLVGEYNKKVREFRQLGISFLLEVARVLVYGSDRKNIPSSLPSWPDSQTSEVVRDPFCKRPRTSENQATCLLMKTLQTAFSLVTVIKMIFNIG